MLSKIATFNHSFGRCSGRSIPNNEVFNLLLNRFCNLIESPELPNWFKTSGDRKSFSEDDFVIPTDSIDAFNCQRTHNHNHEIDVGFVCTEIANTDADKISRLLKNSLGSPDAVVQSLDGCDVDVSKALVDKILKRYSNDWVPAFGFFNWASMKIGCNHSIDSYDLMVDILGKSKQFDVMWTLVDEMVRNGGLVSLTTMAKIMRRLAGGGRWMDAIETFHKIENFGVSKDVSAMNVLLDAMCKERCTEHAKDVFLDLRTQIPPNSHSFNILIHGWCKARRLDEAESTMEEMKEYGFSPCVISYTCLIEAHCRDKNFRKVSAILDEMQNGGCPPNVVTYTIVMHSLGKAKETLEALQVWERMKKHGCSPDTSFYNSLIYILGEAGRLSDARNIFEEMSKRGISPDVTTYNTLIASACKHSQEENALKLLKCMEESSCRPDLKTYTPLLKICCRKKRMKILSYLLNDMFKKDISLDLGTYSLLVDGLCRNGKLEHSCLFFKEMVLKGMLPRRRTYDMLMEETERKNMKDERERIGQLMIQAESMNQYCYRSRAHDGQPQIQ